MSQVFNSTNNNRNESVLKSYKLPTAEEIGMTDSLWFFTDEDMNINLGTKPSTLASFIILTRTESAVPFKEPVTQFDLEYMGYQHPNELMADPHYHPKVRIYVRKKYGEN